MSLVHVTSYPLKFGGRKRERGKCWISGRFELGKKERRKKEKSWVAMGSESTKEKEKRERRKEGKC